MPDAITAPPINDESVAALLRFAREAPLVYGTWNRFKSLYKQAQASADVAPALAGALLARVDDAPISLGNKEPVLDFVFADGSRYYDSTFGIVAVGNALFALRGSYYNEHKIVTFTRDLADPLKAKVVGTCLVPGSTGNAEQLTACGSLLCFSLTDYQRTQNVLMIADVSDPAQVRARGKVMNLPIALCLGRGTQPFPFLAAARSGAFQMWDLRNPDAPKVAAQMAVPGLTGDPNSVAVGGSVAVALAADGLRVLTLADPSRPRLAASLTLAKPTCVAVRNGFAYVSVFKGGTPVSDTEASGLYVVDVRDPAHPRRCGFMQHDNNSRIEEVAVAADGATAYVRAGGAVWAVDVRDPFAPVRAASLYVWPATGMTLVGSEAYIPAAYRSPAVLSLTNPRNPVRVGTPPSADTIGYMKRRGRRTLRDLAKTNPARLAEIAAEMLLSLASPSATIDPARHWATIDVLYGGANRFRQTKHGRGRYIPTGTAPKLSLRRREERSPAAWDVRPDLLARLVQAENLPGAVYAFAARVLRANRVTLPALSDAVLTLWLAGREPLLVALGVRAAAARLRRGETLAPALAADAFFKADAQTRRLLALEQGAGWANNRAWAEVFAERLAALVAPAGGTALSRRQRDAAGLLARYFAWAVSVKFDLLLPLVAPLLATGAGDLVAVIVAGAAQVKPANLVGWLAALASLPDPARGEPAFAALSAALKGVVVPPVVLRQLVFNSAAAVRAGGWRLIAASATDGAALNAVWTELLRSPQPTPALETAMASPHALGLLERAGIGAAELSAHVSERPFLVGLLSPEAFGTVAATAPASVVLSLVAASPDAQWLALRPIWLAQLRSGVGTAGIWLAAEAAVGADETGRLEARLLGDAEIADTLLSVDDERLLAIREPAFGAILAAWAARHDSLFARNSALFFDAATHPLPEVRSPALARVAALGMDMPFALRLVESRVPPSVGVGKAFFDAEPVGGEREADYALALCDSYDAATRQMGRKYVSLRWGTLPHERILSALFENPAPEMQAFVAALLGGANEPRPAQTPVFDGEVLRARNRARPAKEKVKARQASEQSLDVETLLALARGRTPRDAEWALQQLALRAMRGEAIAGLSVEGVAGI